MSTGTSNPSPHGHTNIDTPATAGDTDLPAINIDTPATAGDTDLPAINIDTPATAGDADLPAINTPTPMDTDNDTATKSTEAAMKSDTTTSAEVESAAMEGLGVEGKKVESGDSESESESEATEKVAIGKKEEDSVLSGLEEELEVQGAETRDVPIDTPLTTISYIGRISKMVQNSIVVEHLSDSQPTLDIGSILCLKDKVPLGPVFETFGPVVSPFYRILVPQSKEKEGNGCISVDAACMEISCIIQQRSASQSAVQDCASLLSTSKRLHQLIQYLFERIASMQKHPNLPQAQPPTAQPPETQPPATQPPETATQAQETATQAVAQAPQEVNFKIGEDVYFVEELSKTVKPEDIYTPGCDASTFNDKEEEENIEFSDDEEEKRWKKKRKFSEQMKISRDYSTGRQEGSLPNASPGDSQYSGEDAGEDAESNWKWQAWPKGGRGQGRSPATSNTPPESLQPDPAPNNTNRQRPSRFSRRGRYGRRSQRSWE
eukprot:TRINITY_DN1339_c0_g1_i5.p1 TRINITY_DN1339_c0_g1~~TRINITY_DN1339_c0_g1_i5.p1  ORF type:complete len:491 (-),score=138.27 TRINITY_DN1339_c0_g1_i5:60-1532(-)